MTDWLAFLSQPEVASAIIFGWVCVFAVYSGPKLWRDHGPKR